MNRRETIPGRIIFMLVLCVAGITVLALSWGSWRFGRWFNYSFQYEKFVHEQIERETAPLKSRIEALEARK